MKVKLRPSSGESTTRMGDWYAIDLVLNRKQFILCVSSKSRLAVALDASPYANFPDRLCDAVTGVLKAIGVNETAVQEERLQMDEIVLAKTVDKSILGTMNECRFQLDYAHRLGRLDLNDTLMISLSLSKLISLALPEGYPRDAALKLFGQDPPDRRQKVAEAEKPIAKSAEVQGKPRLYILK